MTTTVPIRLHQPPRVVAMSATAKHGVRGTECYRLSDIWCLNLFVGEGVLTIDGESFPIAHGFAGITWPGVDLRYQYRGAATLTWVHFVPASSGAAVPIPVMQDLGAEFPRVRAEVMEAAVALPTEPERAAARVWDTLWRLTARGAVLPAPNAAHPALRQAIEHIEQHLALAFSPTGLARRLGISATHLSRLFRQGTGLAPMAYIRRRRAERAAHLLRHTTLPIARIGQQVGILDPHLFNKTLRRELGRSPRALRLGR